LLALSRGGLKGGEAEKGIMMSEGRRLTFLSKNSFKFIQEKYDYVKMLKTVKPTKVYL